MKALRKTLTTAVLVAVMLPAGLTAADRMVVGEMFTNTL
jgi:hypothetical protein